MGDEHDQLTVSNLDTIRIKELDHSKLLPGDLAVTKDGIHIITYLGDKLWIEADPGKERVLILSAEDPNNEWINARMKIVRWRFFQEGT